MTAWVPWQDHPDHGTTADEMAPDLRRRSSRSMRVVPEPPIERELQTRWSAGGCGKVAVLADQRDPGSVAAARLPCKRKTCRDCGPVQRAAMTRHYTAAIGDTPVGRRVYATSAWRSVAAKLRRAGAQHLRIPAPGGEVVVYATAGEGHHVEDLAAALAADFAATPAGTRVTSSKAWARSPVATRGEGRWTLLGLAKLPLAGVVQHAKQLGLYVGEVDQRALAADWAEAHLLRRPPDDPLAWRRFTRWIGLHWPQRHRRPQARAA